MKKILVALFILFAFAGCNDKRVELVTVNAAAYLDGTQTTGNFALLKADQVAIFTGEDALDRYFATVQTNSKVAVKDFTAKALPGEYVLAIQLKEGNPGVLYKTYTYNYITLSNATNPVKYVMQFKTGAAVTFQPWVDRK